MSPARMHHKRKQHPQQLETRRKTKQVPTVAQQRTSIRQSGRTRYRQNQNDRLPHRTTPEDYQSHINKGKTL